jgi:hypothetical protein
MRVKTTAPEPETDESIKCRKTVSFKVPHDRKRFTARSIREKEEEELEEGEIVEERYEPFSPTVGGELRREESCFSPTVESAGRFSPTVPGKNDLEKDPDEPQTQAWPSDEEAFDVGKGDGDDKENEEPNVTRHLPFVGEDWAQSDMQAQPY